MSWLDKLLPAIKFPRGTADGSAADADSEPVPDAQRNNVPEGLWRQCPECSAPLYHPDLERQLDVCDKCGHHIRLSARRRLDIFLDPDGREEISADLVSADHLNFKDTKQYKERLRQARKKTGEKDALVAMHGQLKGMPVVAVAFDFAFLGGSMGYAVGQKFTDSVNAALKDRKPLICFSATGGARMQEALISLLQMAKTSAVLERLRQSGTPYISVLTDPVYGGVSASLAALGDIIIAEPDARAGFSGPNIVRETIGVDLPENFQRSHFLLEHGAIDMILPRKQHRDVIAGLLAKLTHHPKPAS